MNTVMFAHRQHRRFAGARSRIPAALSGTPRRRSHPDHYVIDGCSGRRFPREDPHPRARHGSAQFGISTVLVDGVGGAESAVRHLIEVHGHTRIACISAEWPAHSHMEDRVTGWRQAMQKAGLPAGDDLIIQAPTFDRAGGRAAIDRMIATTDATAAFITSDIKAVGALDGLRSHGVRVPQDFAVVSMTVRCSQNRRGPR